MNNKNYFAGCELIDSLKLASSNLGLADVRHLKKNGSSLLDQMQSFHMEALQITENTDIKISFLLKKIKDNIQTLKELLDKPWNSDLEVKEIAQDDQSTSDGGYHFKLATPLKEKTSYTCEDCSYQVTNHVVFKRHVKSKHGKVIKVDAPKVTCRLPHPQRGTHARTHFIF